MLSTAVVLTRPNSVSCDHPTCVLHASSWSLKVNVAYYMRSAQRPSHAGGQIDSENATLSPRPFSLPHVIDHPTWQNPFKREILASRRPPLSRIPPSFSASLSPACRARAPYFPRSRNAGAPLAQNSRQKVSQAGQEVWIVKRFFWKPT